MNTQLVSALCMTKNYSLHCALIHCMNTNGTVVLIVRLVNGTGHSLQFQYASMQLF